ncbi:Rfc5p [Culex quinquefasciatus]|uniref:Rfc5p n=1 Tax=Culex quinquefasciatus TaxID=7176 RepID=B0X028_CULQU|nr:Rfc5p [Culex quinquefasciatus]|eukprot:XP_001863000.1 Rfc5p [Culex quinquefasciatus]
MAGVPARDRQSDLAGTESAKAGSEPGAAGAGCPIGCDLPRVGGNLSKNCDMRLKTQTLYFASLYEHRMQQGSKHIFHRETSMAQVMMQEVSEPCVRDGHG